MQDIGDRRFLTLKSHFTSSPIATKAKVSALEVFVFFLVHCSTSGLYAINHPTEVLHLHSLRGHLRSVT